MGGTTGGNKSGTNTSNTGAPNWQGWQGGAQGGGNSGLPANLTPGTEAYNNMNTALTTMPMQSLVNLFQSGGMGGAMGQVMNNLLNSSGSNANLDAATNMFQQLGTTGTQNFQNLYNAAGQPGANQQNLSGYASGSMINANPYVDQIVNQASQQASDKVNQQFAAGGRYGSGMDQGTVAEAVANINNQFRGAQYNQDVANQLQASGLISNEQLGRMGIQSGAASGVGGLQTAAAQGVGGIGQNQMQNWLTAQQGAAGIGNQGVQNILSGMGQLGNVQNNKMFDANQQLGVGNQTTQSTQDMLNALAQQWGQGDMANWARLGGLLSAGTGSAGNWGTATGSTTQSSQAGLGSIIGGILSLASMSDRRLKRDISQIREKLAGLPLYAFRYTFAPAMVQIGVMSDEVREVYPEAVTVADDGYDRVDYDALIAKEIAQWA